MNIESPTSFEIFLEITKSNKAVCVYLSTPECNVCKVLKPKTIDMLENDFPGIFFCYVDLSNAKEISGQLSIFSVPTILVYFEQFFIVTMFLSAIFDFKDFLLIAVLFILAMICLIISLFLFLREISYTTSFINKKKSYIP